MKVKVKDLKRVLSDALSIIDKVNDELELESNSNTYGVNSPFVSLGYEGYLSINPMELDEAVNTAEENYDPEPDGSYLRFNEDGNIIKDYEFLSKIENSNSPIPDYRREQSWVSEIFIDKMNDQGINHSPSEILARFKDFNGPEQGSNNMLPRVVEAVLNSPELDTELSLWNYYSSVMIYSDPKLFFYDFILMSHKLNKNLALFRD